MPNTMIPFNKPYLTGREVDYIAEAGLSGMLSGDGGFTKKVHAWLEQYTQCNRALLTHSCTAALEMSALLIDAKPGDEIIIPSYTFVSTANAFVLRGATPVFVDIRPDTLNVDENRIESAVTARTKAIVPVHYAGVSCQMDKILEVARKHNLYVIEDAAQGVMSKYNGRSLGALGDLGTFSFHETKNVISGEGGALIVSNPLFAQRAEILREKGTNRSRFFRGEVDKYSWCDIGSSYLPGEVTAAFLWGQLQAAESITRSRMDIWKYYHSLFEGHEVSGLLRRPSITSGCEHNAHMYYVLLNQRNDRQKVLSRLKERGIHAVFHYVPLHSSLAGRQYGRIGMDLSITEDVSERLVRLPLWIGLNESQQDYIAESLVDIVSDAGSFKGGLI